MPKTSPRSTDIVTDVTPTIIDALQPGRISKIIIGIPDFREAAELGPQSALQLAQALATGTEWAGHTLPARKVLFVAQDTPYLPFIDDSRNLATWTPAKAKAHTWDGSRRSDQIVRIQEWRETLAREKPEVAIINDPIAFFGGDVGFWQHRMQRFQEEAATHNVAIVLVLYPPPPMFNSLLPERLRPTRIYPSIARGTQAGFVLSHERERFVVTAERRRRVAPAPTTRAVRNRETMAAVA